MSKSSRPSRVAGYMLLEALVAVAVAGLVLAAFVQTHAVARQAARLPEEILEPSSVAQALVSDWLAHPAMSASSGRRGHYAFEREVTPVQWMPLAPRVAPPLKLASPAQSAQPAVARSYDLRALEVRVRGAQGRQLLRETVNAFATR